MAQDPSFEIRREPREARDRHHWLFDYLSTTNQPSTSSPTAFALMVVDFIDYVDIYSQEAPNVGQPTLMGQEAGLFKKLVVVISGNCTEAQLVQWESTKGESVLDGAAMLIYKIQNASILDGFKNPEHFDVPEPIFKALAAGIAMQSAKTTNTLKVILDSAQRGQPHLALHLFRRAWGGQWQWQSPADVPEAPFLAEQGL